MRQETVQKSTVKSGKRMRVVGIILLCCILAYMSPPVQTTFKPIQYSESNGRRQFDYRYFGIIPYSKLVDVPGLDSNSAVEKQFADAGLELPPGFAVGDNGAGQTFYESGVAAHSNSYGTTDAKALYSFYKTRIKTFTMDQYQADDTFHLEWDSLDGTETVRVVLSNMTNPKTGAVVDQAVGFHVGPKMKVRTGYP